MYSTNYSNGTPMSTPRLTPVAQRAENAERRLAEVSRERDILREVLKDLAENGTRFDTNPTVIGAGWGEEVHQNLVEYIGQMDTSVRTKAKTALREAFDS